MTERFRSSPFQRIVGLICTMAVAGLATAETAYAAYDYFWATSTTFNLTNDSNHYASGGANLTEVSSRSNGWTGGGSATGCVATHNGSYIDTTVSCSDDLAVKPLNGQTLRYGVIRATLGHTAYLRGRQAW